MDAATRAAPSPSAHTVDRSVACRTVHSAAWPVILRAAFWPASFAPARAPPRRPRSRPAPAAHSSPPELPPEPRRLPDAGRPACRPTRRRTNLSSRHAPAPASRLAAGPARRIRARLRVLRFGLQWRHDRRADRRRRGHERLPHQSARRHRRLRRRPIGQRKNHRRTGRSADGSGDDNKACRAHETRRRGEITPFGIEIGGATHLDLRGKRKAARTQCQSRRRSMKRNDCSAGSYSTTANGLASITDASKKLHGVCQRNC